jgi:hypothetical protein
VNVVAPWAHDHDGNSTDPINLVFENTSSRSVSSEMQSGLQGWRKPRIADNLYVYVGNAEIPNDAQLSRGLISIANAFRRVSRLRPVHPLSLYRCHVRFWDMPSNALLWRDQLQPSRYPTIASAHVEPALWFHNVESFDWAETLVARQLGRLGWSVHFDSVPLGNKRDTPPNNGFATRAWR